MSDLVNDNQLKARDFWVDIKQDESGSTMPYPREFVKSSEMSCSTKFRAPKIGEHNSEIYKEIGISSAQLLTLREAGII